MKKQKKTKFLEAVIEKVSNNEIIQFFLKSEEGIYKIDEISKDIKFIDYYIGRVIDVDAIFDSNTTSLKINSISIPRDSLNLNRFNYYYDGSDNDSDDVMHTIYKTGKISIDVA